MYRQHGARNKGSLGRWKRSAVFSLSSLVAHLDDYRVGKYPRKMKPRGGRCRNVWQTDTSQKSPNSKIITEPAFSTGLKTKGWVQAGEPQQAKAPGERSELSDLAGWIQKVPQRWSSTLFGRRLCLDSQDLNQVFWFFNSKQSTADGRWKSSK